MGGVALQRGNIIEMKTGEGKTLVATLPLYLNALMGKGVHLVTVNDYLARRDAGWMGRLYGFLGMSTGVINSSGCHSPPRKQTQVAKPSYFSSSAVKSAFFNSTPASGDRKSAE